MRPALTTLAEQSRELTFRLLRAIALSLGQEKEFFVNCHQLFTPRGISKIRSIYYPPINGNVEPGVVRCGEHSGKSLNGSSIREHVIIYYIFQHKMC